jgi:hypothetical protein
MAPTVLVSLTFTTWSPGRMKWVKLRAVLNFWLVWMAQVSSVSSAVQSNGSWISPQLPPRLPSPPGAMLL